MAIKKAFQPIVDLLSANKAKKVSEVFDQVSALCEAKGGAGGGGTTVRKDDKGNLTHILCYYHKTLSLSTQMVKVMLLTVSMDRRRPLQLVSTLCVRKALLTGPNNSVKLRLHLLSC